MSKAGRPPADERHRQSQGTRHGGEVTGALGGLGIFGVELFVKGDAVWFSEVSPRPHDTGLVTLVSQYQSEFALHARAILGLPVDTAMSSPGASAVIYGGADAEAMTFDGVDEALKIPGTELRLFGKPQSFVSAAWAWRWRAARPPARPAARAGQAAGLVKPLPSR